MNGLSTRTTPLGWNVVRVYYSADPGRDRARRGEEWYAHARKGMKDCDRRKEYEVRTLRFREWKGNVTDKDPPRDPQDKNRHLIDCLGYIELAGPIFVDRYKRSDPWEPIYPNIGY